MKKVYNKLVRDKMIDVYEYDVAHKVSASAFVVRYADREETLWLLKDKLREETEEFLTAYEEKDSAAWKEEMADVIEVLEAILHHNDMTLAEVLELRDVKKARKGGFENGLFLESIDYFDDKTT